MLKNQRWLDCFSYLISCNFANQVPPFVKSSKKRWLYYLTNIAICQDVIRMVMPFLLRPEVDFELLGFLILFLHMGARQLIYIFNQPICEQYLIQVNQFLTEIDSNPINTNKNQFFEMWGNIKPVRFFKIIYWIHMFIVAAWEFQYCYYVITDLENAKNSFPYWSPYYDDHWGFKCFYTILDCFFGFFTTFQMLFLDVLFVSLMKYQNCQLLFLKNLINELFESQDGSKLNEKNIRWWIMNHQTVLRSYEIVSEITKPVILVTYIADLCTIVFSILSIIQETNHQDSIQKYLLISLMLVRMAQFGWECSLADKMNETHQSIIEKAFKTEVVYGGPKKLKYFFSFVTARSQKAIKITAFGAFSMTKENFKDLVYATFSFYTSLMSFIRRRNSPRNH